MRRLRLYDDGAAFPRDDPDGSTSLLIQMYHELIPAAEETIDEVIAVGDLARYPAATGPALAMMQELARSLVVNDYYAFSIEPAWARTLGRMVQEVTGVVPASSVVASARRAQIARMVERFSSDPRLSSDTIAETLGVSRRTLYDLTATEYGGISEHIRATRARRAAGMLRLPESLPLAEIALRTGFSSEKQLRRALLSVFDATPAAIRGSSGELSEAG
ncbi:helix-turn-helix domain-containing protein [Schumannella luteola]